LNVRFDNSTKFWTLRAPKGTLDGYDDARFKPVKTPKGWRLNVPASLSSNQKRSRRFFQSREEADGFASKLRTQLAQHGTGAQILPPAQADAAVRAFAMLLGEDDAAPETLLDAVREYINRHKRRAASLVFEDAMQAFAARNHAARLTLKPCDNIKRASAHCMADCFAT
jgi:hypothetical protein